LGKIVNANRRGRGGQQREHDPEHRTSHSGSLSLA
jgi:hypothetical protein